MRRRTALLACIALALGADAAQAQVEPRIVGGSTTTISQYPWQAAVVYDPAKVGGNPFQRQLCGGSLVTAQIVLTAGHCIHGTDPQNFSDLDPDDVDVILGQTVLSTAPPSSEFNVQGVAKQSGYNPSFGLPIFGVPSNDVGYLVLQSPYDATTPIDIAGPDEGALWDVGSPEQITGWGATTSSGAAPSDTLRHATVPIVSDSSCASSYGSLFNSSTMVCAGFPQGGVDTCFGDSGGPMQAAIGGGVNRLVGITSWGSGCAKPNAPGVYTRAAETSLRSAIASMVFNLETTFGLQHEDIIGSTPEQPPPTSPPAQIAPTTIAGAAADATPPVGRLSGRPKRGGAVLIEVGCNEDCRASAGGVVVASRSRFALTKASAVIAGGGSALLKLVPKSKTARRAIRRLLASGARAKAKIKVTLADGAGNAITEKLLVKLGN
jgi:secreted trypsin-like serine protease